jgi:hypothetical protein
LKGVQVVGVIGSRARVVKPAKAAGQLEMF